MSAPDELVSIIIPVFDGASFVGDAIRAALDQDHSPIEVIVVDDGSTDATPEVVADHPGVQYLRQDNAGPSAARNTGIAAATGRYVTFCDSDDRFRPTKVGAQLRHLRAHPEVGCVLVGHETFLEPGIERPAWERDEPGTQPQSAMVRREVLDDVGGFDTAFRFAEGIEWLGRLRAAGVQIAVLDEVHVDRRIHGRNLSYERAGMQHHLLLAVQRRIAAAREAES
jgi:glycosyltransferase involved in cell wall biosynthesis